MTDIIIYTTPEKLIHKQDRLKDDNDKSNCCMHYWEFSRLPKRIDNLEKIYFATDGFIRGYFLVSDICEEAEIYSGVPKNSIYWNAETWKDIKPIKTKSFQEFKYVDKVPELS